MSNMYYAFAAVMLALLLPLPFVKSRRNRASLLILSLLIFVVGALAYLLSAQHGPLVNLGAFCTLIATFWLASRFEAK